MSSVYHTTYHDLDLPSGVKIHYIQAGSSSLPTLLLLHGYPSSSDQFRNLIPLLSSSYHILAPDLPAFGLTTVPTTYVHSFDNLKHTVAEFLDALKVTEFAMYIFDYGAPTGLRLALDRPQAVKAVITQNGNAYEEGLGERWASLRTWWKTENPEDAMREKIKSAALNIEAVKAQYIIGTPAHLVSKIDPLTWQTDYSLNVASPEQQKNKLDLFFDYRTNVALYPAFQKWLKDSQVPVLAVWGKNDPIFIPPGAEAFKRDVKGAKVELLDGGHFLLETHGEEVAEKIKAFLREVKW